MYTPSDFKLKDHPEKDKFCRLVEWINDNEELEKSDISKVELFYFAENYRGVLAKQDIKEGEIVFSIHYSKLITFGHIKEEPIVKRISEREPKHHINKFIAMCAYSMLQRSKKEGE